MLNFDVPHLQAAFLCLDQKLPLGYLQRIVQLCQSQAGDGGIRSNGAGSRENSHVQPHMPPQGTAAGSIANLFSLQSKAYDVCVEEHMPATTILHMAARFGRVDCLQLLIQQGGADPAIKNAAGCLPADDAALVGNMPCLRYLAHLVRWACLLLHPPVVIESV